jgi:hypothetical protein
VAALLAALVTGIFALSAAYIESSAATDPAPTSTALSPSIEPSNEPSWSPNESSPSPTESPEESPTDTVSPSIPPGSTTYLDSFDPVGKSDLDFGPKQVTHTTYAHALYDEVASCVKTATAEYVLPKGAQTFVGIVGLADDSDMGDAKVKFTFYVDGSIPKGGQVTVGLKEAHNIEFSVQDGLRLKLEAILIEWDEQNSCNFGAVAVWGDPRLL